MHKSAGIPTPMIMPYFALLGRTANANLKKIPINPRECTKNPSMNELQSE